MSRLRLEFWYEFASTYSYLSAMRIGEMAAGAGVEVTWRPFLLGPIFAAQGWNTSPFTLYPAKGAYMFRDMERLATARGLAFSKPDPFPQHSLNAARLAFIGAAEGWVEAFSKAVYLAAFAEGEDISRPDVLVRILDMLELDSAAQMERIQEPATKEGLKRQTEEARQTGIFGAPTFVTPDGEMFWGDDRLEQALQWVSEATGPVSV